MSGPGRNRIRLRSWGGPALIAIAYLLMFRWTNGRWPDVLFDFGRELYAPWQLKEGKVLYRDLAWFNGPFSAYLNALWFRLFGASLQTLVFCNAAIAAGMLALLYLLLSRIGNRFSATVGCLLAVALFCFGNLTDTGSNNFICPYSHEATHGLVLSLAALFFLERGLTPHSRGRAIHLMLSGLALGLVLLTKIEIILALGLALACRLLAHFRPGRAGRPGRPRGWPDMGILAGGAVLPVLAAAGLFWGEMRGSEALLCSLGAFRYAWDPRLAALPFYRWGMGTLDPASSAASILLWSVRYAVVLGPAAFLVWWLRRARRTLYVATAAYILAIGALFLWERTALKWPNAFHPLPLILAALIVRSLIRLRRKGPEPGPEGAGPPASPDVPAGSTEALRLTLGVFSLALLLKMALNVRIQGYGFVLALPGVLLLATALLAWIPDGLTRRGGLGRVFAFPALACLLCLTLVHLTAISHGLREKQNPVGSGTNRFLADSRGAWIARALQSFPQEMAPGRTLAVLPEGVMLNFLSGRTNPTPYVNFMPPELIMFGEERMLAALQKQPPDFVAVIDRPTPEYGLPLFGTNYGRRIWAWVQGNYRPVWLLGKQPLTNQGFGIMLLRFAPTGVRSG